MEHSSGGGSRHVRTEDLLDAPPIGRAVGFAALAAVAGAVVWALLIVFAQREAGVVAWGIGGLIGFAIVKAGGHGQTLAVVGAVLAVVSIAAGKQISFQMHFSEGVAAALSQTSEMYDETRSDAEAWAALGDSPSDDEVEEFALARDFDVDDAAELREEHAPYLESFIKEQPTREEWVESRRENIEAYMAENFTFMDYLRVEFSILDIVFAGLGLATAFGMVHKRTVELHREAREQLRVERAAQEEVEAEDNE